MRGRKALLLGLVLAALSGGGCEWHDIFKHPSLPADQRPHYWAKSKPITGVKNVYRVDDGFYRGNHPTTAGWRNLERMGFKTSICMRTWHCDDSETRLKQFTIPMSVLDLKDQEFAEILDILTDPKMRPVYVYCWVGSDRVGAVTAVYRVMVQGWSKEEALDELKEGGYGYHPVWNEVERYVTEFDPDVLADKVQQARAQRKAAGDGAMPHGPRIHHPGDVGPPED